MYNPLTISIIVGYFIILCIHTFTIVYIIRHSKNYVTILNLILILILVFNTGILYSTLFVFSIIIYQSESVTIMLWKLATVIGFITLGIMVIISSFMIEYKKILIFPFLCFTTLFGFLIGNLFFSDSVFI